MAIDLVLPEKQKFVTRKFQLPESLLADFDMYVLAAQDISPAVSDSEVLQAILEMKIKKDRKFSAWLKNRKNGAGIRN